MKTCLEPIRFWCRLLRVTILAFSLGLTFTSATFAATFLNGTRILMGTVAAPPGPYPSVIDILNIAGTITNLTVKLTNVSHTLPDDMDVLLVGPQGQKVMLMSDTGGSNPLNFVHLRFSATATASLPDTAIITGGTYRPSNFAVNETLPSPAPNGPYANALTDFDGISPNGTWRLYANDDTTNAANGAIGGWYLEMELVVTPVSIVTEPQDRIVSPGSQTQFQVVVNGTPPFSYQWMRNGQIIVPFGQGGPTLGVFNVSSNDAGFYSVMVSNPGNAAGVASRQARLDVTGVLTIVDPPQPATVQPGVDVRLYVGAAGTPPLRYQWTLNGIPIPGETNAVLNLPKVTVSSGGDYRATVWNGTDATSTRRTVVFVTGATSPIPPNDDFADRPRISGRSGVLQGNSANATTQPGEIIFKGGGRTVWFEWIAPQSGIVTFNTRGSSFDTLLRAFTGDAMSLLRPLTGDDDRGGFYTSQLRFNAVEGERYQIQTDGFSVNGRGGPFTIKWGLEPTQEKIPVAIVDPAPQAVARGASAFFKVETEDQIDTFQWFLNGQRIAGATQNFFFIPEAKTTDVGRYTVRVENHFGRFIETPPVSLQIGSLDGFPAEDKREAMLYSLSLGEFIPIGLGSYVYQIVPVSGDHDDDDPIPCGSPFFGTLWQGIQATNNGIIEVDTIGSDSPARLAVYRITGDGSDFFNPAFICDLSSASNGVPAVARFQGQQGTNYAIVLESTTTNGNLQMNCKMGLAPALTNALKYCSVPTGGSVVLNMPATNWCPLPTCQWRRNGIDIPGATSATLTLTNFGAPQVGTYSVRISNFVSTTVRNVALVSLAGPFSVNHWWTTNGAQVSFVLNASNSMPFVLETSTDLNGFWSPIATNPDPCFFLTYTNTGALLTPQRFFRAAPWSP